MPDPRGASFACAVAACLWVLAAPATSADPLADGAKLCLYPMVLPFSAPEAERRRPELQQKLITALGEAAFDVADPAAVEALEEGVRREVGGTIDPVVGVRDGERYRLYREQLAAALRDELGCHAQLYASIVTLQATFISGVARWDGTTQQVSSTGRIVLNAFAGVQESGWVAALSLWLRVTDLLGVDVAFRSAGIETPVQLAVVEDKDVVTEDHWLTDGVRLGAALYSALGPRGDSLRHAGRPGGAR